MDEQIEWVTVKEVQWLQEALIVQSFLLSQDIESFIPEQHTASIHPIMTGMRVRVQVLKENVSRAREALKSADEASKNDVETCSSCGSTEFRQEGKAGKNWFRALFGFLMMTPMRAARRTRICIKCGQAN